MENKNLKLKKDLKKKKRIESMYQLALVLNCWAAQMSKDISVFP